MLLYGFIQNFNRGYCISAFILSLLIFTVLITYLYSIYSHRKYAKKYRDLLNREELFDILCTNINDVFIIYNLGKHNYEYISPNIERIYGINVKQFRENSLDIIDFTDPCCKKRLESIFTTNILTNYCEMECEFKKRSTGQLHWIALRIYPIINKKKVSRYICCVSDLTREKQSQQILKNAFINAQKANEAKKEFLSHMSHELRTPINAIIGMAKIAENSPEDQVRVLNCLDKITISSKNLLEIINNILDMAKIDSNKLKLSYKAFCLSESMNYIASIFRNEAELNRQSFELAVSGLGDRLRLEQILTNCLSNSFKFTPSGGKIRLELCEEEHHANKALYRFTVSDNGKGMSEDFMDRLFIPFEQEDSSIARRYEGSGLGMSITKDLVTLMGGNIKVASRLGEGAVITIDIVFEIAGAGAEAEAEVMQDGKEAKTYDFTGRRALIVEDNEINQEITCELLKYVKMSVEVAGNGYEAIKLFTNSFARYYDLIIMDLQMPGLNGYDTARAIRGCSHPDADTIMIIALSADAYAEDITFNMENGMNYYVAKPIEPDNFYALLSRIFTVAEAD